MWLFCDFPMLPTSKLGRDSSVFRCLDRHENGAVFSLELDLEEIRR